MARKQMFTHSKMKVVSKWQYITKAFNLDGPGYSFWDRLEMEYFDLEYNWTFSQQWSMWLYGTWLCAIYH